MRLLGAIALSVVCAACMGSQGCGARPGSAGPVEAPADAPAAAGAGRPDLRLVAMTDLAGYLEPCGCQSRPLGGIDKAAAQLGALRADGIPTVFVAAGDLLFGDLPAGAASAEQAAVQETWKAETLVGIFEQLQLAAATPGPRDFGYGLEPIARLEGRGGCQLLPAKPRSAAAPEDVRRGRVKAGAFDVGLVGVSTFAMPGVELDAARERALMVRVQTEVEAAHADGAALVVALVSASQRFGRRLAGALRGTDLVIVGGNADGAEKPPVRVGDAYLLRARSQGHGLLVVDLFLPQSAPATALADVSAWTRGLQRDALRARERGLATRIAAWERDPGVDKADLAEQRAKLRALQEDLASAAASPKTQNAVRRFDARFLELAPETVADAHTTAKIAAYDARVNEHNRTAFASLLPPTAAPDVATYVGADRCKACHAGAYRAWSGHAHARAYATLTAVNKQFNLSCVACHVTGYLRPGGSSVVHNEGLVNVGCESCHGPGSDHAAHPRDRPARSITRDPAAEACTRCHTPEHSDRFDYTSYRAHVLSPGHGLPEAAP